MRSLLVYLSTCLLVYLSTCLLVYLSTCLLVYLSTCFLVTLSPYSPGSISVSPLVSYAWASAAFVSA
ncbi:MAG: hypothetical protein CVU38_09770 [Chloroflexi bacterium HGW-Chloroflexi-1]|nr:MAG: hypothetical protein CVU38_09770 [Chloroflexi bacterium HGW-Chloroflexi-1]